MDSSLAGRKPREPVVGRPYWLAPHPRGTRYHVQCTSRCTTTRAIWPIKRGGRVGAYLICHKMTQRFLPLARTVHSVVHRSLLSPGAFLSCADGTINDFYHHHHHHCLPLHDVRPEYFHSVRSWILIRCPCAYSSLTADC